MPCPIIIPDVMELTALADARILVEKHLPAEYRSKFTWRQFAGLLKRAAEGQQDVAEVSTAPRIESGTAMQCSLGATRDKKTARGLYAERT